MISFGPGYFAKILWDPRSQFLS